MNPEDNESPDFLHRYSRQIRFPGIGVQGQKRIARSKVLLVGCGALGSAIADTLVRAGVGDIRIVDRDILDLSNLQRQSLYDESDVESGLPKAIVAKQKLQQINSRVKIEAHVVDVTAENIEQLAIDRDLILDGTDNFEIRFLINDVAIKHKIPWIFGGCLGCDGQVMAILPGESGCLRCLMPSGPPETGAQPTCDSFGILAPIINMVASLQSIEGLKLLSGNRDKVKPLLMVLSLWDTEFRKLDMSRLSDNQDCRTCGQREFEWLNGERGSQWSVLCGRNSIQLTPESRIVVDLTELAAKLSGVGNVSLNPFVLKLVTGEFELSVFPDGRTIVSGTEDVVTAKKLYTQFIGL